MKKTILLTLAALAVFFSAVAPDAVAATVTPLDCATEDIPVYVAVLDRWGVAQPLNRGEPLGWIRVNPSAVGLVPAAESFIHDSGLGKYYRLPSHPERYVTTDEVVLPVQDRLVSGGWSARAYTALYIEVEPLLDAKPQATLATIPTQYVSYQPAPYVPPDRPTRLPATGNVDSSLAWLSVLAALVGGVIIARRR